MGNLTGVKIKIMYQANVLSNQYAFSQGRERTGLRINLRAINNFLIGAMVISFLAFLIGNNDLAVKSFVLKDLKTKLSEVSLQNKELEIKVTALSSYQHISQRGNELKFVPATDVHYLPVNNQALAKR